MTDNPDTCFPPADTPYGSWHWLQQANDSSNPSMWGWRDGLWHDAVWSAYAEGFTPDFMQRCGWLYRGPVAEPEPVKAERATATEHHAGCPIKEHLEGECECAAAPSPADALLRETLEWLGVETPLSGPSTLKLDALRARIRQHLGEK